MTFPSYPAYKDSGVEWLGEVPEHWGVSAGRRIYKQIREAAHENDVQLSATQKFGVIPQAAFMEAEDQKVMLALNGTSNFKRVARDDFVISLRSFQGGIEHSAYDGCVSPAYTVLRARNEVHPRYMAYTLKCASYIDALQSITDGIRDGKNISYEQFGELCLPLPSISEQIAVATFLDRETAKIDALVAEQEKLIELLKEKRQAVISHAVTKGLDPSVPMKDSGVEWLGEVPAHWEVSPLKRFWSTTDCKHVTAEFVDGGYPLASIREVQGRWVDLTDAKRTTEAFYQVLIEGGRKPEPGDLIFSRNATVGEVGQVSQSHPPFAMGQDVVLLRRVEPEYSPDFLQSLIRSDIVRVQLENMMVGSTFKRINVEEIRSILLPFPSAKEQESIATRLQSLLQPLDVLDFEAHATIDMLQERRSALISAAVTGQIDVREQVR